MASTNDGSKLWGGGAEGPWMETYTGKKFHILHPQPAEIDVIDIAHALSNQCRYTGHVSRFYSVAEHCVHVSRICEEKHALRGLLHDASEAYLSDINRPAKRFTAINEPYMELEGSITAAICRAFDVVVKMPASVKVADDTLLGVEARALMHNIDGWADHLPASDVKLLCWAPEMAKAEFLVRFKELTHS